MRVDKVLEQKLQASRKQMKQWLKNEDVIVNGKVVTEGNYDIEGRIDTLTVEGKEIGIPQHDYYMLHKPKGVVTANTDAKDPTIFDYLPKIKEGFSIGRLDKDTTGLIIVTNNGRLGYHCTQAKTKVGKWYEVTVNGPLTKKDEQAFLDGITFLDGTRCRSAQLWIEKSGEKESEAKVYLTEGKRHQIKKMFLAQGVKVTALKRTQVGPIVLDEQLEEGEYRPLTKEEIEELYEEMRN
ncbi:pseudouridine synthase [Catellicoccus marimammalium]|uniref:Pseudouridine synthase n=1 Tax=Catellicoccus marimammalium M35/04/3 TaxID=1234409 RepID=K8ZA35_9ENTE|nr:pseudouridine synthase [Catellicoccus marimammalium]EKU27800.1 Ribosomal small subunit pseudouridine synthase A [Catellicoccus marimammalium M35/04/3]